MKYICIFTILLLTTVSCSDVYKYKDKRFSVVGRLVDYQCHPVSNTEVYALNIISSPGAYNCCGASVNNTAKTDDQGRFNIDLYEGEWAYLGTGESHKLFTEGNILQSYDHTALTNLRKVATQGGHIVIYTQPKFEENYSLRHSIGWSKQPRVWRTPNDDLKNDGSTIFLSPVITQEGAVGLHSFNLAKYIDMRIRSVESDPEPVYQITIQGRENVGLLKAVTKGGQHKWDIPTDGYSNNVKYTFTFPSASYPYELEDKWVHETYFIKANDGAEYAVVTLNIALVSSFDMELHDQYSTEESWVVAVWVMADVIASNNYGFSDKKYRHRLPITSPVIPHRTCGGDYESTHTGTLGHHPKIYQRFFDERKKSQDYMLKKLTGS